MLHCGILTAAIALVLLPMYRASCPYGHAPGRWVQLEDKIAWQLFDPQCQLDRLVDTWARGLSDRPYTMLLIGDSTDRLVIYIRLLTWHPVTDPGAHALASSCSAP